MESTKMSLPAPSVKSKVSSKSIQSARMKINVQRAATKSDHKFEEEEEQLEIEMRRRKRDLMKRKEEARLIAQEKIIEEFESDCSSESRLEIEEETKDQGMNRFFQSQDEEAPPILQAGEPPVMIKPCPPAATDNWNRIAASLEACMTQLTKVNMQQMLSAQQSAALNQLPKIDVPIFSGDPLQYPIWRNAFDALVDSKPLDCATKLNFLSSFVTGSPKEIVEHYQLLNADDGYKNAREALAERYGSSSSVSVAFMERLSAWRKIGIRDARGMRDFSDFLHKIVAAKKTIRSLGILDYPQENVKLLEKLPNYMENRWRDEIKRWRETYGPESYPPFEKFAEFVKNAASLATIPELESLRETSRNAPPMARFQSTGNPKARAFSTRGKSEFQQQTGNSARTKHGVYSECPFCKGDHSLDECNNFKGKPMHERKSFFFQRMLCMGCGVTDLHQVKDCPERKICKECEGRHLTCLHYPKKPPVFRDEGTARCTTVCSIPDQNGRDHCMIVPVWVRHTDKPNDECLVYAVLDDQSNVSFMSEKLRDKLKVEGTTTNLLLTTMHGSSNVESKKVRGLEILDFHKEHVIQLPVTFSREEIPASRSQIPKKEVVNHWPHLRQVADEMMPYDQTIDVSILIGNDCPRAIRPRQVVTGGEDDPYAQKSLLGWGIIGKVCLTSESSDAVTCHKTASRESVKFATPTSAKEVLCPQKVIETLEKDFADENMGEQSLSVEDQKFLKLMGNGIKKRPDGHYEMPLPLKSRDSSMPYNRHVAEKRWNQLNARFRRNPQFKEDYKTFMADVLSSCAERAPSTFVPGKVNYVPHTGVYHPQKPGKIRVVFDCSAKCEGVSLNDHLLQGPDLTNGLLGVLCRFRQEDVAFMADIKGMFHQFYVCEEDRDMLRFLWWEDGDPNKDVVEYRMMVHLFGATSSPGCANFGFKKAADDGENEFGSEAASFIREDFYVDDGIKSVATIDEAVSLLKASRDICEKAGLRLHKLMSNKKEVLQEFPVDDRAKGLANLDLDIDPLPVERALGIVWCAENDTLQIRIELRDRPLTRRGILSTVCSIYDPNGFASPVTLRGKQILQDLCRRKIDWDSPLPDDVRPKWEKWRNEIAELQKLEIPRCYKPAGFGEVKCAELHHFSDASYDGYGQCSYLRLINDQDEVSCSLVVAKSRVTPLKLVTIPRLELTAATISAKMSAFLRKELRYDNLREFFWTDSKIVLGYINNEARRFHVYVANRVQQIHEKTKPGSWFYVDTNSNPADDASRGMTAKELLQSTRWMRGPKFLQERGEFQSPRQDNNTSCEEGDPEVRKVHTFSTVTNVTKNFEPNRLQHISSWQRAKRAIALCLRLKRKLQNREVKRHENVQRPLRRLALSVAELEEAEKEIVRTLQAENFPQELEVLNHFKSREESDRTTAKKKKDGIKPISALYRLDPYVDNDGIMRIGGRIMRADVPSRVKHPVIMPRNAHLTTLLVRNKHAQVDHMGRGITHNELRQTGYWVIGGSSAVSRVISKCVTCRKLRGSLQQQKMSDLPKDRLDPAPPFTYCAVDYFGPFLIKEKRSLVKRYGVLFTCMASRAIHLEAANSLSSSSFINCLRRFLNRRGPVRQIRSDRGTAFVGARNELRLAMAEMNQEEVQKYLTENGTDWIPFLMNTPRSSHMGGVWERQIATVRRVLEPLLKSSGSQLDDDSFQTFLTEAEAIVNARPLTTSNLCAADAPEPLTPNHLLTMKERVVLPPPGKFQREDVYALKWWRRVQYLVNEFWVRWRREYLQELQQRQKWVQPEKDIAVGDVVIVKEDDSIRSQWPLGRVAETYPSQDGSIRKVKLQMANRELNKDGSRKCPPTFLERPIHKIVLLLPSEL